MFFALLIALLGVQGDTLAEKIMWKVYNKPVFNDMHSRIVMTLLDTKGNKRLREMESWSKTNQKTHETKMLIKFVKPADIKGTSFLIYEHKDRDDDMWFYLPALRKVKRLAASGKAGSFMGSDFSNYDIGGGEYEDWTYRLLREEVLDGDSCWVVEAIPKGKDIVKKTGYTKMLKWVSKNSYVPKRSDYYDRSGALFKRIVVDSLVHLQGVYFETKITAINLDSGHKTVMEFKDLEVNKGLRDDLFTLRSLKK